MTPPLQVAEPADEPQVALIATCVNCRGPIARFNTAAWTGLRTMPGRWRHDNWAITCPPPDPPSEDFRKGNQP